MTVTSDNTIIAEILKFEHSYIASKLGLIKPNDNVISNELLYKALGLVDRESRKANDLSRNIVVVISSILWTYRDESWEGLRSFLILVLSRIGYSPSSIMIDDQYNKDSKTYSSINSMFNKYFITAYQMQDEIYILNKTFQLTSFQRSVWNKIDNNKTLGISAPTSAGKSFIIALKCIDLLVKKPGTIIYIVPTLSLVTQVSLDFRRLLNDFNLADYEILNTYNGAYEDNRKIYVFTQEKAIGAFSQSENPFHDVRMLVVDEIQNVERVSNENDQRAKTLFDLLVEFRHSNQPDHIVISGPRIENIGALGYDVFGEDTAEEDARSSPVSSITYAISKKNGMHYFKQYTVITKSPLSLQITENVNISGIGGVRYMPKFLDFLSIFVNGLGENSRNIIFSPSAPQSRRTANHLAKNTLDINNARLTSLIQYIKNTVHDKYDLCDVLRKGIAYHHGKLPHHVRRVLEIAISEKLINNVICTTTLMQGVNLPAQNVIIRNPNLFVTSHHGSPQLTNYEIANLRGRAGRLLKDFIGRTFVLDENSFETKDSQHNDLFDDVTKEIRTGYGQAYLDNKNEITNCLLTNEPPSDTNSKYSFLLTYIRQTILRHKEDSINRFNSVGITISESHIDEIRKELYNLVVPVEICLKNRYWDPIDLNKLFLMRHEFNLPLKPMESGIALKLKNIIQTINENFPLYYKKYYNVKEVSGYDLLYSACVNTEHWLKEQPLRKILQSPYYDTPDKIDQTITMLQNTISYGLPMLLKPLYDIKNTDSSFLRFIELGAYKSVTRRLIEYNIPRETAITLSNTFLNNIDINDSNFDRKLLDILKKNINEYNYWDRAQLEVVLG